MGKVKNEEVNGQGGKGRNGVLRSQTLW